MKLLKSLRPTWQFWAILIFGYAMGGVRSMLFFLAMIMMLALFILTIIFLIARERSLVVERGLLDKDNLVIKFLCKRGKCTWSKVEVNEPKTELASQFVRGSKFGIRIGKSNCVCCGKELWLDSYNNMDRDGVSYWTLMDFEDILAWNMAQEKQGS